MPASMMVGWLVRLNIITDTSTPLGKCSPKNPARFGYRSFIIITPSTVKNDCHSETAMVLAQKTNCPKSFT